ncbi:hypothetical protein HPB50_013338 [Hyalomma asiaticum]|uniref:Uncharacterized protein n=1 Tax=Hyalomma asiaticum TaxID=266040 RepID=A0ACB7S0V2_HYAAI|nr:hypothetical protein HPB50_013338 [Hyalomma asiaticum]
MPTSTTLNNAVANDHNEQTERKDCHLDPTAYTCLKVNIYGEHLKALGMATFRQPRGDDWTYLDLGCGPANFLQEILLPRLRPCKYVVAADSSREMLDYAQQHHQEPEIIFELLDIEHGDPDEIVAKHGQFDRVYAFLIFHFVKDLDKAYRNLYRLLKQGGECVSVNFTRTGITDVWHQIYEKDGWNEYIPNPVGVLSKRFRFNEPLAWEQLVTEEKNTVAAAGLNVVACHTYSSQWTFPSVNTWLENYVPFFKLDETVPKEHRGALWEALTTALLEKSQKTSDGPGLTYHVMVTHMQKPAGDCNS